MAFLGSGYLGGGFEKGRMGLVLRAEQSGFFSDGETGMYQSPAAGEVCLHLRRSSLRRGGEDSVGGRWRAYQGWGQPLKDFKNGATQRDY